MIGVFVGLHQINLLFAQGVFANAFQLEESATKKIFYNRSRLPIRRIQNFIDFDLDLRNLPARVYNFGLRLNALNFSIFLFYYYDALRRPNDDERRMSDALFQRLFGRWLIRFCRPRNCEYRE